MESFQKSILLPLLLSAWLPGLGFCYSITKGPENATVLAGSEARFNCTVSAGWKVIIWLSKGSPVLTVTSSQGSLETTERFTSRNYTSGDQFTSELVIHSTQLSDSGRVECSIQQPSDNNFAFLSVQENAYSEDNSSTWVVVVAVVCSFLGLVLLIVVIVVAVRCCLKRRGSTYQNEIRKVSAEKKKDGDLENSHRSGSENLGYIPEELWNTEQSPRLASFPPKSSKFAGPDDNLHISSVPKVRPQRRPDYLLSPKKIRNVTLV